MPPQKNDCRFPLPAGLVVLSSDGAAQFGWQNPETGAYYAEEDGRCILTSSPP